jgi:hypothetical protein
MWRAAMIRGASARCAALTLSTSALVIHVTPRAAMRGAAASGRRIAVDAGFDPVAIGEAEHRPGATVILAEAQNRGVSDQVCWRDAPR